MGEPFVGSEAVARGEVLRTALRTHYIRVFYDVYVSKGTELTPLLRARAAWLWSRRRGIIAGLTASALHGSDWAGATTQVEILHDNRNSITGLRIRGDRIADDEITEIDGIPTTTPVRTALDLACWYPTGDAVAAIDALTRATRLPISAVAELAARYPGRRSIRWARTSLSLVDAGAQSPQETWLRLQLVKAGLPTPQTQIPVCDESGVVIARLQMGWPNVKVGVVIDTDIRDGGDRWLHLRDRRRMDLLERLGWRVVMVSPGDRPADVVHRVRATLAQRVPHQPTSGTRRAFPC